MKKIIGSFIMMFILFGLVSCGLIYDDDSTIADKQMNKIFDTIEDDNKESIRSLFAKSVLEVDDKFNDNLNELLEYYQGNYTLIDRDALKVSEDIDYGKHKEEFSMSYIVTTNIDKYYVSVKWVYQDDFDSSNIGIHEFYIIKYENNPYKDYAYWGDADGNIGIIIDKPYATIYIENLIDCIKQRNKEGFKSYFSNNVIMQQEEIDKQIHKVFELFDGYYDYENSRCCLYEDDNSRGYQISYYAVKENDENQTTYSMCLKYCTEAKYDDQIGAVSFYITYENGQIDMTENYWGDGNWTPGVIVIVQN